MVRRGDLGPGPQRNVLERQRGGWAKLECFHRVRIPPGEAANLLLPCEVCWFLEQLVGLCCRCTEHQRCEIRQSVLTLEQRERPPQWTLQGRFREPSCSAFSLRLEASHG